MSHPLPPLLHSLRHIYTTRTFSYTTNLVGERYEYISTDDTMHLSFDDVNKEWIINLQNSDEMIFAVTVESVYELYPSSEESWSYTNKDRTASVVQYSNMMFECLPDGNQKLHTFF